MYNFEGYGTCEVLMSRQKRNTRKVIKKTTTKNLTTTTTKNTFRDCSRLFSLSPSPTLARAVLCAQLTSFNDQLGEPP